METAHKPDLLHPDLGGQLLVDRQKRRASPCRDPPSLAWIDNPACCCSAPREAAWFDASLPALHEVLLLDRHLRRVVVLSRRGFLTPRHAPAIVPVAPILLELWNIICMSLQHATSPIFTNLLVEK